MTTGRKGWLYKEEFCGNEHEAVSFDPAWEQIGTAIEGVFLTTAELDTLVAAAEARGWRIH